MGCQAGTRPPQLVNLAPGTASQTGQTPDFLIKVFNYTQQDIIVSVPGAPTGVLIHRGGWASEDIHFLPYSVTVSATTTLLPIQTFPDQVFILGRDFNYKTVELDVYYY
jgi:hypothetical protein